MISTTELLLTDRFASAFSWALQKHSHQVRHNTNTPYISHLMTTAAIVLEEGGGEDVAVAALLHDVLEDQPVSRDELREEFGARIYRIVADCTDADFFQRREMSWAERKELQLRRMCEYGEDSLLVIAADKAASLQSLLDDTIRFGMNMFDDSSESPEELLSSYQQSLAVLRSRMPDRPVVLRLSRLVAELSLKLRR
ncbi:(p)ppGpp synthase/HD superfamily hydrolase [Micromonospora sp. HB375]|uniref:HD domain-containing protein n=1 Tax=Micromonospora TaxID=1873 RepID=UPI001AE718B4|nr:MULTISPECIES: HD domain-containing protein [unclassified Micromonospora]MBP1780428.1 (p)ppGpp synthase/HD superfamily hydrolase [Micromonospora sp. HB375]MDH6468652.1 (p)ppGpp synthase/HD superfamily hydrolase [Micromonospora sp. H404/HB375]